VGYVEQIIVPTLKRDVVVIDNLSVHKVAGLREAMQAAGAHVLYLALFARLEPN
jgi:transposase